MVSSWVTTFTRNLSQSEREILCSFDYLFAKVKWLPVGTMNSHNELKTIGFSLVSFGLSFFRFNLMTGSLVEGGSSSGEPERWICPVSCNPYLGHLWPSRVHK